jgi:RimJ/RimL family protein N-acetyltransferase
MANHRTVPATGRWPEGGVSDGTVRLRGWRSADVQALLAIQSDPEARRWSPIFSDPSEVDCLHRIERAIAAAVEGLPAQFAVVDAADDDAVLGSIDWRNGFPIYPFSIVDVGYVVGPWARGRGVAGRSLALMAGWLLDPDGGDVERVQLDHAVENEPSCRTALRAGFAIEGRRERFLPLRDTPSAPVVRHEVCLHGRVRAAA